MQSIKVKCDLAPILSTITWKPCCIKYCRHTVRIKTNSLYHRPKQSSNEIRILQMKFEFKKKTNLTSLTWTVTSADCCQYCMMHQTQTNNDDRQTANYNTDRQLLHLDMHQTFHVVCLHYHVQLLHQRWQTVRWPGWLPDRHALVLPTYALNELAFPWHWLELLSVHSKYNLTTTAHW